MKQMRGLGRLGWVAVSAAAVAAVLPLAGCKVDQVAEVSTYKDVLHAKRPTTSPTSATTRPRLAPGEAVSLAKAVELANDYNETLAIQGESYLQSVIDRRRALAAFLPTVSASGSYGLSDSSQGSNTFSLDGGRTNQRLSASLGEQVNLFNGFADVANNRRAAFAEQQSRALLLDVQQDIFLQVANLYYETLVDEASLEVLKETVEVDDARIAEQRGKLQQGVIAPVDLAQTESNAATNRIATSVAATQVQNDRDRLAVLLGVDEVSGPLADELPLPTTMAEYRELLEQAYRGRQDLIGRRYAVEAARQGVKIAVAQYYPSVNLNLSQLLYRDPASGSNWSAGLSGSLPIFSAGLIEADVRTAWSRFRQAVLDEARTERLVQQDVRIDELNFRATGPQIRDRQYGVAAARQAFEQTYQANRVGTRTNREVLDAQNDLRNARLALVRDVMSQKQLYLQLLRSLGQFPLVPPRSSNPAATQPMTAPPATVPATVPSAPAERAQ